MSDDIEVMIDASKSNPKLVEVDAMVVAKIIMLIAHAREKPAKSAANAIMDYFVQCMQGSASLRN